MKNPYLDRLLAQHEQLRADSKSTLDAAALENRELTQAEEEAVKAQYEEIKTLEAKIEPLREGAIRQAKHDRDMAEVARITAARREPETPEPGGQLARYQTRGVGHYLADWGRRPSDPAAAQRIARAQAEYRVVADQKLADNPGIVPVPIVGPVVDTLNASRPFIASVANRPMPGGGSTFNRPKITQHTLVGAQTAEKTQLASQKMTIVNVPVTKKTFGGTLDISLQDVQWTEPAILSIAVSDLAGVYAKATDNEAADTFVAAVTGTFVLAASPASGAVRSAILTAANQIAVNVGLYPDTVWMAPDVAATLGAIVETGGSGLPSFPGLSQVGSSGELMGLRSVVDANFAAGTMIVGISSFVEHYETVGGLLSVTEPTILGYTIAYYGYVADLLLDTGAALKRVLV